MTICQISTTIKKMKVGIVLEEEKLEELVIGISDVNGLVCALKELCFNDFSSIDGITLENINALNGVAKALEILSKNNTDLASELYSQIGTEV